MPSKNRNRNRRRNQRRKDKETKKTKKETKKEFTCDVCSTVEQGSPHEECCGMKYCFPCIWRTAGRCYICKKDELNEPIQCDVCGKVENGFTIQNCCLDTPNGCDMWVCGECNKAAYNPAFQENCPFKYCSFNHFRTTMENLKNRFLEEE